MTLTTQFYTLIVMVGMGSYFGAALDTYNRFLKRSTRKTWLIFINDFLFWVVQGLIIFYALYLVNEGELRFYLFLALLCGFAAYQALFKAFFNRSLEILIKATLATANFSVQTIRILIVKPIKWLISGIILLVISIGNILYSIIKWLIRCCVILLKIIFKPCLWILLFFWNILPKPVTKNVGKFYNIITGFLWDMKKSIIKIIKRWRNSIR